MKNFYVPYAGRKPAAMSVNGHRLVLLFQDLPNVEKELELIGADRIKRMNGGNSKAEESQFLEDLSKSANAGVVIAPSDVAVSELLHSLEAQLPWLQ